jgi:hypothetical protein
MRVPLSLEDCLILACARTDPDVHRIQELAECGPDWQAVLRKTERWGLAPLAYTSLRHASRSGGVPKPVTERLRHLYHRDTIHGVEQREALRETLRRFSDTGVPVIVLKGAALAALVYPAPTLRPMRDIDLLVRRRDIETVNELLGRMRASLTPERFSLLDIRHHISPAVVDRIPIEEFWSRARPAQIESVATLVFSHEDLLLHLALHLAHVEGFVGRVRTLCDIRETCKRYQDAIDWHRLVAQAEAYEVGKELYHSLRLARDLLGAGVPAEVLEALRATFGRLPLESRFIAAVTRRAVLSGDRGTSLPPALDRLGVRLVATRGATDAVTLGCRLAARWCQTRLRQLVGVGWRGPSPGSGSAHPPHEGLAPTGNSGAGRNHVPGEVAVTYDQGASDGVGSQLHRIFGIYALSRALQIKYVHAPLAAVGYQGLLSMLARRTDPDFATRYNAFFSLPSDDFDTEGCERVRVHALDEKMVDQYRKRAAATGRAVLLRTHMAYPYLHGHPAAYQALRAVSPYRAYRPKGPVRVCIHLRRGDNSVRGREAEFPHPLPNAYFVRVCGAVLEALRRVDAPSVVRLHTEVPRRPYTLHPGIPGVYFRLDQPMVIDPADFAVEDFETLPNLEVVRNVEAREALDDFATADVLILSLSSFGYVGGLLNPHGLVICPPTFHVALPDWLVPSEQGDLDSAQLATRVATQLRWPRC